MPAYRAFGMALESELPLPGLHPAPEGEPDVAIEWTGEAALESHWSGTQAPPVWETRFPDGCQVRAELGVAGDQRLTYGDRAVFQLSRDARNVRCAVRAEADPSWQRFLLDTVLWWLSLERGMQVIHASGVEFENGVLAFASATGGGKTSLAAELVRRGHPLFCDDVLVLERRAGSVIAHPGPGLMNLPFAAGDPGELGRTLATFEDQEETWVAVERTSDEPRPVTALFLLHRGAGLSPAVERLPATALNVLPHAWGLPHAAGGARQRFEVASDLVGTASVYSLTADRDSSPAVLADLVESTASTLPEDVLEGMGTA